MRVSRASHSKLGWRQPHKVLHSMMHRPANKVLSVALLTSLLAAPVADTKARSVLSADPLAVSSTCKQRGAAARPFVRTELFFGARKPDGSEVSRAEWVAFLDKVITPAFPDGLTVLTGTGRFRGSDGVAIEEKGMVLILLYPHAKRKNSGARIEKIRVAYKRDFLQESVLRVDDPVPVCVSL